MSIRQKITDLFVTKHCKSFGYSNLRFRCRTIRGYGSVLCALVCMLLSSSPSSAQSLEWAKQAGGTNNDRSKAIAVDTSGNSYVTGGFQGSATFGAGEANETTLVSTGANDIVVAKYDGNGDLVWAKQAGGTSFDVGSDIAVDTSGNSYVTGSFLGSATFGAGEANETMLVSAGGLDIFVAKYDSNGDLVWAKQAGGTSFNEPGVGIAVDTSGNSYVTGRIQGSATFGAGEANETTLVSAGGADIFVVKYDGNGDLVWAKQAGGTSFNIIDAGLGIAVDTSGNSYVTGFFDGSATFGAGEANETTLPGAGGVDIFVARYDGNGVLAWAKQSGGTNSDLSIGIAVDTSGNSYVTGGFSGSATFGAGEANETTLVVAGSLDIFVARYDGNGDLVWALQAGGTSGDIGRSIAVDTSGNSYVTGNFNVSATFGAGEANETTLLGAGGADIFVAKYEGNGDLVWAIQAGGTNSDVGIGIAVDTSGNSYVTGTFNVSATFGAGKANETTLVSAGLNDIFVAKFSVDTDSDGDGVDNADDACPGTPTGEAVDLNGCSDSQVDSDGDGFCDPGAPSSGPSDCSGTDNCPDSDLSATIIIDGIDTGVENELLADGCTLADLIDAIVTDDPASVDVVEFLVDLKAEGFITGQDLGAILKELNSP